MMLPECQKYFDLLMQYCAWLIEEYGFVVIHVKNGCMASCSFILQSGDCRLFMSVERGQLDSPQLALAPSAAQLDACASGLRWYHVGDILDYLRGQYPSWSQVDEQSRSLKSLSADEIRARSTAEYRAFWPRIMTLFREEVFRGRQRELEDFLREKNENQERQRKELVKQREAEWWPKWREEQR
jgi:hypothetical protein